MADNLYRINPETGEVVFGASYTGDGRGLCVDDAGYALSTAYNAGGPPGVTAVYMALGAAESRYFDSIRGLNTPLAFPFGGRMQGILEVANPIVGQLDTFHQLAACNTISGPTTVAFPGLPTSSMSSWMVGVWDYTHNASTNPITINPNGNSIENPEAPGTFTSLSFTLKQSSVSVVWVYDWTDAVWKVFSYAGPIPIGAGGSPTNRVTWDLLTGLPASSTVGSSTPQIVGSNYLDIQTLRPATGALTREVFFKFILSTTNASNVANIDLIDVNNVLGGGLGAEVPGTNFTTTSTTPTYFSQRITALEPLATGGIFQVRIWLNPQAAGQQVTCFMAKLDVEYH